jgi:hypothetical protein
MDITFERSFAEPRGGADAVRRLTRSTVVVALFGALVVFGAVGALASTRLDGFADDPVSLTTAAGPMFTLPALAPGQTVTRYATVASSGPAPSQVRLFASVSGTGLARFLTLTVTSGTGGTKHFVPDRTDHGAGPGIVFRGPLSSFPQTMDEGLDVRAGWTGGASRTFRFEITLADEPGAQGLTAGADFRWEARAS